MKFIPIVISIILAIAVVMGCNKASADILRPSFNSFVLTGNIGGYPSLISPDYSALLERLQDAKPGEKIFITLKENHGGWISSMLQIVRAMKHSRGTVYTTYEGQASSAAMDILFAGDVVTIPKMWVGVAHMTADGKGCDGYLCPILAYYKQFLTREQFYEFMHDADLNIYGEEVCKVASGKIKDTASYCVIRTRRR